VRPALLLAALLTASAAAQTPVVLNGPVPFVRGAALLDAALFPDAVRGDTADTTAPWRYYPLHVGDVWEYYDFAQGLDYVRWVGAEEFHDGRRYALVYEGHVPPGAALTRAGGGIRIRFDTTTARVYGRDEGNEFLWEPCPFDASFGGQASCSDAGTVVDVSGGYERVLVFPQGEPPDTLVTAVKLYDGSRAGWYDIRSFAADLGMLYWEDEFRQLALYYANVGGVEYGRPRHPVATEPFPAPMRLALSVAPNPAADEARLSFALDRLAGVSVTVHDALGRRVLVRDLGRRVPGRHDATLDLRGLAPGVYVVRVMAGTEAATRLLTRLD
jgi:hypothetical protein